MKWGEYSNYGLYRYTAKKNCIQNNAFQNEISNLLWKGNENWSFIKIARKG